MSVAGARQSPGRISNEIVRQCANPASIVGETAREEPNVFVVTTVARYKPHMFVEVYTSVVR